MVNSALHQNGSRREHPKTKVDGDSGVFRRGPTLVRRVDTDSLALQLIAGLDPGRANSKTHVRIKYEVENQGACEAEGNTSEATTGGTA